MANSENTLWIVSCVRFGKNRNGNIDVGNCNGRAYRSEKYARGRYNAILDSLKEEGYSISKIKVPENEEYEGIRARRSRTKNGTEHVDHLILYLDRNPVWNKKD